MPRTVITISHLARSPEFPEPVVPIYESTFCLCGNKHFNLRERDQEQEQLLGGETAE